MLTKLRKIKDERSSQGFTIIEVMIVLAIAGLILLIVFLAVPALQRNARNTSIKSDAGNVASGISTWESDNGGQIPTSLSGTGDITIKSSAAGTNAEHITVSGTTLVKNVGTVPTAVPLGEVHVYFGQNCAGTSSTRAVSVYYSTESSSTAKALQCIDT